jgi:hypothetical protein
MDWPGGDSVFPHKAGSAKVRVCIQSFVDFPSATGFFFAVKIRSQNNFETLIVYYSLSHI